MPLNNLNIESDSSNVLKSFAALVAEEEDLVFLNNFLSRLFDRDDWPLRCDPFFGQKVEELDCRVELLHFIFRAYAVDPAVEAGVFFVNKFQVECVGPATTKCYLVWLQIILIFPKIDEKV